MHPSTLHIMGMLSLLFAAHHVSNEASVSQAIRRESHR